MRCGIAFRWRVPILVGTGSALAVAGTPGRTSAGGARVQGDLALATASVTVSPETVTVGGRFQVRIRVRAPKVATIHFPDVPAGSDPIEPADPRSTTDGPPGGWIDRTATYAFVAWEVGTHAIPLDTVIVVIAGRERVLQTGAMSVHVRSLLPADSAAQVPRAARPLLPLPGRLWQVAIILLVAIAIAALWWRHTRTRRRQASARGSADAWEEANSALAALDSLALADAGEPGRHVVAHVDVLRRYIERRFPEVLASLDAPAALERLRHEDFPLPLSRVAALLDRDAGLRFARSAVSVTEALALGREARDIASQVQAAYEARLRALERPQRTRRR